MSKSMSHFSTTLFSLSTITVDSRFTRSQIQNKNYSESKLYTANKSRMKERLLKAGFIAFLQAKISSPFGTTPLNDSCPRGDSSSLIRVPSSTEAVGRVAALSTVGSLVPVIFSFWLAFGESIIHRRSVPRSGDNRIVLVKIQDGRQCQGQLAVIDSRLYFPSI